MFKNGTAVTLRELPQPPTIENINNYAINILENYGKVYPDSASADFRVNPGKHRHKKFRYCCKPYNHERELVGPTMNKYWVITFIIPDNSIETP